MNEHQAQGISRAGVDAAFEADEARKSTLIFEGQLLRDQSKSDEAVYKFAEAARIEENLAQRCAALGLTEKSFLHRFSALSLWAQAGNFYQAVALGNELLTNSSLPVKLRQRVQAYINSIRIRRAHWYNELAMELEKTAA